MTNRIKKVLLAGIVTFAAWGNLAKPSIAQSLPIILPAPLPIIGTIPKLPSSAQETYDGNLIEQVMYIVELTRVISGGITQILASAESTQNLIISLSDAVSGTRTFPVANGPDQISAREGGESIREMVDAALTGASVNPADVDDALNAFKDLYHLDKPFAYVASDAFNKVLVSHMAAQGAIAASTAESSYKRANESMDRIDDYIQALEASVDLKSSLDINTRVNIEVAQQLNELLRTQSALTALSGFESMSTAASHAEMSDNFDIDSYGR